LGNLRRATGRRGTGLLTVWKREHTPDAEESRGRRLSSPESWQWQPNLWCSTADH
jgi:hypothetical protein